MKFVGERIIRTLKLTLDQMLLRGTRSCVFLIFEEQELQRTRTCVFVSSRKNNLCLFYVFGTFFAHFDTVCQTDKYKCKLSILSIRHSENTVDKVCYPQESICCIAVYKMHFKECHLLCHYRSLRKNEEHLGCTSSELMHKRYPGSIYK